ncbi:MAG: hypothetical protein IJA10_12510 [Lachnospiraceae bacterium]|nr:hypothetical protein [Lachnospiraceae bacterium]
MKNYKKIMYRTGTKSFKSRLEEYLHGFFCEVSSFPDGDAFFGIYDRKSFAFKEERKIGISGLKGIGSCGGREADTVY